MQGVSARLRRRVRRHRQPAASVRLSVMPCHGGGCLGPDRRQETPALQAEASWRSPNRRGRFEARLETQCAILQARADCTADETAQHALQGAGLVAVRTRCRRHLAAGAEYPPPPRFRQEDGSLVRGLLQQSPMVFLGQEPGEGFLSDFDELPHGPDVACAEDRIDFQAQAQRENFVPPKRHRLAPDKQSAAGSTHFRRPIRFG